MHFSRLCLVGLIAALIAPLAGCSSRPRTPPRWSPVKELPRDENYHGGPNAILLKYDSNHDGTLTKDELIAGLKTEFDTYDTNHKGCLTPDQQPRCGCWPGANNPSSCRRPAWYDDITGG